MGNIEIKIRFLSGALEHYSSYLTFYLIEPHFDTSDDVIIEITMKNIIAFAPLQQMLSFPYCKNYLVDFPYIPSRHFDHSQIRLLIFLYLN